MSRPTVMRAHVHGREVEVGCYGSGADWVCRLTDPSSQKERHCDAYAPPPDLGFAWLRESDNAWLASGLFHRGVFRDSGTVTDLLYRVMAEAVGVDHQLDRCVVLVNAAFTVTFDGEQGDLDGPGGWAESRWWQTPARHRP